jgi:mannosyl-oligosaccharide alpha-1,2-mannosidase
MFGIGAKIFDRPEDLKTAEQLVDGCIWAYDAMATGLMPEIFKMVPCEGLDKCPWDEKKWLAAVAKTSHANALDNEVIYKFINEAGLPPGMTRIVDSKYILRYVLLPCCLPKSYLTMKKPRSNRIRLHPLSYNR